MYYKQVILIITESLYLCDKHGRVYVTEGGGTCFYRQSIGSAATEKIIDVSYTFSILASFTQTARDVHRVFGASILSSIFFSKVFSFSIQRRI